MELTIYHISSLIAIWLGIILMVISGIGILRFPDYYIRVSAITKAATLGAGLIVIGATLYFNEFEVAVKAFFIIIFLFLTSPIAAHIISREAYDDKIPFWDKTKVDEHRNQLPRQNEEKTNSEDRQNTPD